jgi:RhtB (resistance to homoserine/threonine) family protein
MDNLIAYLPIAAMMVIIPGVDTMLIIKNTLTYGPKAGRYTLLGTSMGLAFWTLIAVLGLSVVIAKSVFLFSFIKYAGAAFLIYLGIKSFFTKSSLSLNELQEQAKNQVTPTKKHHKDSFLQGLLSNILNPKTVLVYITIMPQFIDLNENINQQLIIMGLIMSILAIVWFLLLVSILDYAKKWFNNPKFNKAFQKSTGLILVGFGIKTGI